MATSTRTLLEMAGEVDRIVGNRENDGVFAQAKLWVKRAHQDVTLNRRFKERVVTATDVTVASSPSITKPADYFSIKALRDTTNKRKLIQVSEQRYDSFDITQEGQPTHYTITDTTFDLWPTPDDVYTLHIRYRNRMSEMTADGHVSGIGTEWDQVIIFLAAAYGFADMNEDERAQGKETAAAKIARRIPIQEDLDLDDRDEPVAVLGGFYGTGA